MYKETFDGTLGICVAVCRSLCNTHTLRESAVLVRAVLDGFPWMDRSSRAEVSLEAELLTRALMMEEPRMYGVRLSNGCVGVMRAFNRAYKRRWVRTKGRYVRDSLYAHRNGTAHIVFYLVSKHQKPQEAHRDLQGRVLVDRYWKSALDEGTAEKVKAYIREHGTRTVQWAMGAPHYLITRVNCRHYLIPLGTDSVLRMTEAELNAMYQRRPSGVKRPITDDERYQAFLELKRAIRSRCARIVKRKGG